MNDASFLTRRNSRTNIYGRGARPLDPWRWITLTIDPAYAESCAGQMALLTAANLIGRMTPSVAIDLPENIKVRDPLPWAREPRPIGAEIAQSQPRRSMRCTASPILRRRPRPACATR